MLEMMVAHTEHRDWQRRFNACATRGDFVKRELRASERRVRVADLFRTVVLSVQTNMARKWVGGLLTRPGQSQ